MAARKIKPRTKPRVEDTEPKGSTRKAVSHRGDAATFDLGEGEYEIICQASELVPVAQYASVTIGPIAVKRRVKCDDLDELRSAIVQVQGVLYEIIAEDRESVEESVRLHNQREAEKAKEASKR